MSRTLSLFVCLMLASSGLAFAGNDDDDDDLAPATTTKKGNNADVPSASSFKDDDDVNVPVLKTSKSTDKAEQNLDSFSNASAVVGGKSSKLPLETNGREPLADNYPATVRYVDNEAVVIEMPVLFARSRAEFDGIAYWVVAEAYADGKKVSESRMYVTRDGISTNTPTVHFFELTAPVSGTSGKIEVRVGKAASGAAKPTPLFTRTVDYKLGG